MFMSLHHDVKHTFFMKRRVTAMATVTAAICTGLLTSSAVQSAACSRTVIPLNKAVATGPIPISLGLKYFPVDNQSPFVTGMRVRAMTGTDTKSTKYLEGLVGSVVDCNVGLLVDATYGTGSLLKARFSIAGITGQRGPTGARGIPGTRGPRGYNGIFGPQGNVGPIGPQGDQGIQGLPGSNGTNGTNGTNGLVPKYGSFYDTTTQAIDTINTPKAMTFNEIVPGMNGVSANGVSVVSNSQVTVSTTGTYNIQFSAQLAKTDPGNDTMDIWLRVNGDDVGWTNTSVTIPSSQRQVAAWNFILDLAAGQYFQLMYSSSDINSKIIAAPSQTAPIRPGTPSIILTVTQVQ
jgi:hypothetical protein